MTDWYRKKPVAIQAQQFVAIEQGAELADWCGGTNENSPEAIDIPTLEGSMRADLGDWILRGVHGEFYPCKPEIFDATYDRVDAELIVFEGLDDGDGRSAQWYWHRRNNENHKITGQGEGYTREDDAIEGALGANEDFTRDMVIVRRSGAS